MGDFDVGSQKKEETSCFEAKVIDVLASLLGVQVEVERVLERLGGLFDAKRVRVFEFNQDKTLVENTFEWCDDSAESLKSLWRTVEVSTVPWLMGKLWASERVLVSDVEQMPVEAKSTQEMLIRQGVKVSWFIPFQRQHSLGGFVVLDGLKMVSEKEFGEEKVGWLEMIVLGLGRNLHTQNDEVVESDNAQFKDAFESVDEGILILSKDGVIGAVNNKGLQLLGKSKNDLIGGNYEMLTGVFGEGAMNVVRRNLGMVQMGMEVTPCEVRLDGGERGLVFWEVSSLLLQRDGRVEGSLMLIRDISARRHAEQEIQESERELRGVLDSVKEGIILSDEMGKFLFFNPEMEELTGFSRSEANEHKNFLVALHPESKDQKRVLEKLAGMRVGDRNVEEETICAKDGSIRHVSVSTSVVERKGKKLFLSAYHDVSELKKTTEQLREARDHLEDKVEEKTKELSEKVDEVQNLARFPSEDPFPVMRVQKDGRLIYANQASADLLRLWGGKMGELLPKGWQEMVEEVFETNNRRIVEVEYVSQFLSFVLVPVKSGGYVNMYGRDVTKEKEVDRMKNEFISMVSHQIRTPLTSMRWYSEMLLQKRSDLSEEQVEVAETIHDTSVQLAELVNDLLSLSRMESGRLDYNPTQGSLVEMIKTIVTELVAQAKGKGVEIVVEEDGVQDFMFDGKLLHEVFANLVSNAIKYTVKGGKVFIRLKMEEKEIMTQIQDNGIGIPKEAQEHIFQRFYRAQNAVDTEEEGTGLGLSVAKMMVEKCGGKIWFESESGVGTTFFVKLTTDSMMGE